LCLDLLSSCHSTIIILVPSLPRPGSNSKRARAVTLCRVSLTVGERATGGSEVTEALVFERAAIVAVINEYGSLQENAIRMVSLYTCACKIAAGVGGTVPVGSRLPCLCSPLCPAVAKDMRACEPNVAPSAARCTVDTNDLLGVLHRGVAWCLSGYRNGTPSATTVIHEHAARLDTPHNVHK